MRRRSQAGFTLVELLIATAIMMVVTGAIFQVLNPSQGIFQTQPEVSDMQQRLRVAADSLHKDLVMAGAGTYTGESAGALNFFIAPIMPYRAFGDSPDPANGVFFRPDAISLIYVPPTPSQTTIRDRMPAKSKEMKVYPQDNCPGGKKNQLCGFEAGMHLMIFDQSGNYDTFTVTHVQDEASMLQHRGDTFTVSYADGAYVTQVASTMYYLKSDDATKTYQLMLNNGDGTELPVVDNVVRLQFQYFGEPQPPMRTNKPLSQNPGPWTTYGPRPPAIGTDNQSDNWPAGENCVFRVADSQHVPRLPVLGAGVAQVELTQAMLTDGPWCPDSSKPNRFDADLLRIRRVRVTLRVQAALASLRGPAGVLFLKGGTSQGGNRWVPDQEIRFDVTPRNLNLGR